MRDAVIFVAQLEDGSSVVGPIMRSGGMLGSGSLWSEDPDMAAGHALERLLKAIRLASRGRPTQLHEPKPAHVAMYPDYYDSLEGSCDAGKVVHVPLLGTQFSIVSAGREPVVSIGREAL